MIIVLALCLMAVGLVYAEGDENPEEQDGIEDSQEMTPAEEGDTLQLPEEGESGTAEERPEWLPEETPEEPAEETTEDSGETEEPAPEEEEPAPVPAVPDRPLKSDERTYLWIGLQYGSGAVDKITLKSPAGFLIVKGNNKGWKETDVQTSSTTLTIIAYGNQAILRDADGNTLLNGMGNGGYIVLSAAEDPEDRLITINGSRYRDGATATVSGGKLNVINVVELEHYVRGVVANEMGYTYPIEALKAQAIAARSYGYKSINKHKAYGFDLCTTQDCQVYRGFASEHDSTDDACRQTEGQVLLSSGKIVEAYYYAYSGGATLNSEDVWTYPLDYCKGKVDEYYSDYKWAVHYSQEELTKEMEDRGKNIGDVVSVQVTRRHSTGAVAEVTFVGTKGSARFTKSSILSVLGLKSFMFAINGEQFVWNKDGQAEVSDASISVAGASDTADGVAEVSVIGANGDPVTLSASELRISNGVTTAMPQGAVGPGWTDDPVDSDVVYVAGSGWGHGVGMPQTSAKNMAEQGFTCEDILKYYYEGTEIGDLADF